MVTDNTFQYLDHEFIITSLLSQSTFYSCIFKGDSTHPNQGPSFIQDHGVYDCVMKKAGKEKQNYATQISKWDPWIVLNLNFPLFLIPQCATNTSYAYS